MLVVVKETQENSEDSPDLPDLSVKWDLHYLVCLLHPEGLHYVAMRLLGASEHRLKAGNG